jgi:hypothetical protein
MHRGLIGVVWTDSGSNVAYPYPTSRPNIMELEMTEDLELRRRLALMESRVPADTPPALALARRHHYPVSMAVAALLVLAVAATAVAGAALSGPVRGYPGIENPGQPLAGARMECMSPPQAAAFLAGHGYTDVIWQVEAGGDKARQSTTLTTTAPEHGFVVPGAVLDDGKLHMIVDLRDGAAPAGICGDMTMP